jgi:hypothetical protein
VCVTWYGTGFRTQALQDLSEIVASEVCAKIVRESKVRVSWGVRIFVSKSSNFKNEGKFDSYSYSTNSNSNSEFRVLYFASKNSFSYI